MILALTASAEAPANEGLSSVLKSYVKEGKVDYQGIRDNQRGELQAFVNSLAAADPEQMTKIEQIAFWLDVYNGLVIYQIVEGQGDPETGRSRAKFFRGRRHQVAGRSMTLDDIEHRALRPLAEDPRVHFVLVCGAQSCPPLQASSFMGAKDLDKMLDDAARSYINDPANMKIDPDGRVVTLNKIFDWYAEDFGDVLKFVARYRSLEEQKMLREGRWKLRYEDYDWDLNKAEEV